MMWQKIGRKGKTGNGRLEWWRGSVSLQVGGKIETGNRLVEMKGQMDKRLVGRDI